MGTAEKFNSFYAESCNIFTRCNAFLFASFLKYSVVLSAHFVVYLFFPYSHMTQIVELQVIIISITVITLLSHLFSDGWNRSIFVKRVNISSLCKLDENSFFLFC